MQNETVKKETISAEKIATKKIFQVRVTKTMEVFAGYSALLPEEDKKKGTTDVYFIRHAEPNYENHNDEKRELTKRGLQSSEDLVEVFAPISIDSFYSSPYKRAMDTIAPLATSKQKKIVLVDDFRERKLSDKWVEDFMGIVKKQWNDFTFKLPNGESLKEVQDRNVSSLHDIVHNSKDKTIVVGTHGTALSTIIHYYVPSFGLERFIQYKNEFPWIVRFEFEGD